MARPHPWRRDVLQQPLQSLQSELNRLFEDYWGGTGVGMRRHPTAEYETDAWVPPIDLYETPDEYILLVDLPGVEPSDIDLSVTGNQLTLRGQKRPDIPADPNQAYRMERLSGPFYRQLNLDTDVDVAAIQAESRGGVLRVRLPKSATTRPKTIPVQSS